MTPEQVDAVHARLAHLTSEDWVHYFILLTVVFHRNVRCYSSSFVPQLKDLGSDYC